MAAPLRSAAVVIAALQAAAPAPHAEPAAAAPTDSVDASPAPARVLPTRRALAESSEFARLRAQVRWVPVRLGAQRAETLDAGSRLLLAQAAADRASLRDYGLDFRDVYGVINAETSWVPRTGFGRNGVASLGLAQFEPATARAVGLRDPHDPVEAVHAAALHLREAAHWSARRLAPLRLDPALYARKLREGISIYYNLSSRGRAVWNGLNTQRLPRETRLHIRNVQQGAAQAQALQARLADGRLPPGTLVTWRGPADDPLPVAAMPSADAAPPQQHAAALPRTGRRGRDAEPLRVRTRHAAAAPRGHGSIAWSDGSGGRRVWVLEGGGIRVASSGRDR